METIANMPKEILGARDLVGLTRHEHAEANELGPGLLTNAIAGARCPARHVEIAQPARAGLHLGLEQIERSAETLVARRRFLLHALDEPTELTFAEEARVRAIDELRHERPFACDEAEIEERGRGREIVLRQIGRIRRVDHLMP